MHSANLKCHPGPREYGGAAPVVSNEVQHISGLFSQTYQFLVHFAAFPVNLPITIAVCNVPIFLFTALSLILLSSKVSIA